MVSLSGSQLPPLAIPSSAPGAGRARTAAPARPAAPAPPDRRATAGSAEGLAASARALLGAASRAVEPGERFRLAHLAALRSAAVVFAARGRPAGARRRLVSAWVLLAKVAPELREWSLYFAAGAPVRAAVEAGVANAADSRLADDQLRAAVQFLQLVEQVAGLRSVAIAS